MAVHRLLRHGLLIITTTLTTVESDLKATASSAKALEITSQAPVNSLGEEVPTESCSSQPKPLVVPEPIPVIKIQVEGSPILIKVTGSTVLSLEKIVNSGEVKQIIQSVETQNLTNQQFRELYTKLVNAITQLYLNQGYITSKAVF